MSARVKSRHVQCATPCPLSAISGHRLIRCSATRNVRFVPEADILLPELLSPIRNSPQLVFRDFTNHGSAQDLYSSAGLVAPCRKYHGVPNDGHAEAEKECCHDTERYCCEMQRQQCCTESG